MANYRGVQDGGGMEDGSGAQDGGRGAGGGRGGSDRNVLEGDSKRQGE